MSERVIVNIISVEKNDIVSIAVSPRIEAQEGAGGILVFER